MDRWQLASLSQGQQFWCLRDIRVSCAFLVVLLLSVTCCLLSKHVVLLVLPCWPQGWGTVRFTTTESAGTAIEQFHGSQLEGRTLTVFLDKKA